MTYSMSDGFLEFAEHCSDSVLLCDGEGGIRYYNQSAAALYSWSPGEMLGRNLRTLTRDAVEHDLAWQKLKIEGRWSGTACRRSASGEPVLTSVRRILRHDEAGAFLGVMEIGRTVTGGRLETVAALRAEAARNSQLIHHVPAALWQVDSQAAGDVFVDLRAQGVADIARHLDANPALVERAKDVVLVTDANLAAAELFRARRVEDLIRPVRYLFAGAPQMAKRVMMAHFAGQRSYTEEAKIIAFDGETRDVLFSVTYPIPGELQDTTFILIEDVTDRRRTEEQLRRLQADYSHAARISTLGELATSIAHEVKQPLSAIITNAEASLRWLGKEDPNVVKLKQLTTRIAESAYRANEIIQRIRGMATKHEPERRAIDVGEVVYEALLFVRHDLETRSIDLATNIADDLPQVFGDRILLQQVFVNLLVNAIQAVAPQDLERRRIAIDAHVAGAAWLSIIVADSGPGIPQDALPRLFEGFFTTKEGGMGMGLAICQSLVDGHEGFISAANSAQGGAVFEVRLPIGAAGSDEAAPSMP